MKPNMPAQDYLEKLLRILRQGSIPKEPDRDAADDIHKRDQLADIADEIIKIKQKLDQEQHYNQK